MTNIATSRNAPILASTRFGAGAILLSLLLGAMRHPSASARRRPRVTSTTATEELSSELQQLAQHCTVEEVSDVVMPWWVVANGPPTWSPRRRVLRGKVVRRALRWSAAVAPQYGMGVCARLALLCAVSQELAAIWSDHASIIIDEAPREAAEIQHLARELRTIVRLWPFSGSALVELSRREAARTLSRHPADISSQVRTIIKDLAGAYQPTPEDTG